MTWMPDREAATRRGRSGSQHLVQQSEWSFDGTGRPPRTGAHRMGIPRILGRRARWVSARLRRDG
jgi:hypothetical protein